MRVVSYPEGGWGRGGEEGGREDTGMYGRR